MLTYWHMLKYPIPKVGTLARGSAECSLVVSGDPHQAGENVLVSEVWEQIRLLITGQLTFCSTTPGMPSQVMATCADGFKSLTESIKKISIKDLRLPWKPIYDILSQDLFLTRRQFEYTCVKPPHFVHTTS
jgi:hypothetical protein